MWGGLVSVFTIHNDVTSHIHILSSISSLGCSCVNAGAGTTTTPTPTSSIVGTVRICYCCGVAVTMINHCYHSGYLHTKNHSYHSCPSTTAHIYSCGCCSISQLLVIQLLSSIATAIALFLWLFLQLLLVLQELLLPQLLLL